MIAIRPVLPLANYVVNYNYIVKNLCENRSKPQSTCNGKCYVEKELAKTEKQSGSQSFKAQLLDIFLPNDIFYVSNEGLNILKESSNSDYLNFNISDYITVIFHPPSIIIN